MYIYKAIDNSEAFHLPSHVSIIPFSQAPTLPLTSDMNLASAMETVL